MRQLKLYLVILATSLVTLNSCQETTNQAQKLKRPFIWVNSSDRAEILKKIENNVWAKELFESLRERADLAASTNMAERREKLMVLPLVWSDDKSKAPTLKVFKREDPKDRKWRTTEGHDEIGDALKDAVDNAVLYFLTEESKYAEAAADILSTFVNALAQMEVAEGFPSNRGWIFREDHLYESRMIGAQIPIIYDFVYPFLKSGGKVYDVANKDLRAFDFEAAQVVFRTYISLAINSGFPKGNWSILESSSLVHNILALDDEKERNENLPYYLTKDTDRQMSLLTASKNFANPGDIWPESLSYSRHVANYCVYLMTVLDGIYPDLGLGKQYPNISEALNVYFNLQFPNNDYPSIGDSHRHLDIEYLYYESALRLAKLNNNEKQIKTFSDFLAFSVANGAYQRGSLGPRPPRLYFLPLKLLWADENLGSTDMKAEPERARTNHVPHAGLYVQRNTSQENKIKNSLMAVVAGGGYVHGHASGIDMELYGQGYVLGTEGGKGSYGTAIHENYYRLFAAHNTVISNGASASNGPWINLGIDRVKAIAIEPKPNAEAVSPNFSFATVEFNDKHNLVKQAMHQRILALIKLSESRGYYLDVFRARSETPEQFHDYVYHNASDQLKLTSEGNALRLSNDEQRYQASAQITWDWQTTYQHPGWHFFKEVKTSTSSDRSIEAIFTASKLGDKPIHLRGMIPGGLETEMTQALAPKSFSAPHPYDTLPIPTFIMRHKGDVWQNPFTIIYESYDDQPSVQSVERLMADGVFKGVKVVSNVEGQTITQYILMQESMEDEYVNQDLGITFKGRFGLITLGKKGKLQEIYIGSGHQLSYKKETLTADEKSHAAYLKN